MSWKRIGRNLSDTVTANKRLATDDGVSIIHSQICATNAALDYDPNKIAAIWKQVMEKHS